MKAENHRKRWTQNEEIELQKLRKERKTIIEIAVILGRTRKSVENKLGIMGILLESRWTFEEIGSLIKGEKPASRSDLAGRTMLCRIRKNK